MTSSRRIRLELLPADQVALGTIADLVGSDAEGSAEFGGFYGHAPQKLATLLGEDRRVWVLNVDGKPVGFLDADLIGDTAHLAFFVVASHRGRGIASDAVGRFLGMRVWPEARRVRATTRASNIASRRVLSRTGFVPVESNDDGEDVWERPAAEPRREGVQRISGCGRADRQTPRSGQ